MSATRLSPLSVPDVPLRLAVLSGLLESKVLPPYERPADGVHECDPGNDDRDYEYREEVAEDLLALPVTAAQLAGVRSLSWHTSSTAISLIWRYWDGEGDEFDVMSLEGIAGALPNLEVLQLELCQVSDLSPLARCGRLRELTVEGGNLEIGLGPLAGLGSLRRLTLESCPVVDLRPLAGLDLEDISLDGCHDGTLTPVVDLAPLEDIASLQKLTYYRMAWRRGSPHPVLTAFDNARVIARLEARGVELGFER
ncbi:DUF6892 domain-containing protein [Streptomyces sp. NPDC014734]|uniref:DUF6892 domain-containing protein n=1 Tax=Streptomyces sp. NPDC014734 TaxID=3364886 RepID=UPI0036FD14E3